MKSTTISVFGGSGEQVIRIPPEFRLEADRVQVMRAPNGDLILHPLREGRGAELLAALEGFDADFVAALEADRSEQPDMQDRERL